MTDYGKIDSESRNLVLEFLGQTGSLDIGESSGNCVWDLSCVMAGQKVSVEIKDRTFPHDRYGDVFAEEIKRLCVNRNYSFDKSLVINVFTDGVFAIADLNSGKAVRKTLRCPRTTLIEEDDHQPVEKAILSLPQTIKIRFSEDGRTGGHFFERI